jgi:hypothetical protein
MLYFTLRVAKRPVSNKARALKLSASYSDIVHTHVLHSEELSLLASERDVALAVQSIAAHYKAQRTSVNINNEVAKLLARNAA